MKTTVHMTSVSANFLRLLVLPSIFLLVSIGSNEAKNAKAIASFHTRIVGGLMDTTDAATYQISLQALVEQRKDNSSKYYHFCSGSIISRQHILTAAHCLAGWRTDQLLVVAGTKVWNRPDGVRHKVARIEIHERYEKLNGHDIGLITLKEPLKFGLRISNIAFDDTFVAPDQDVVLTGWGYTLPIRDPGFLPHWIHAFFKSYPKELQITRLKTISNNECRRSYSTMRLETELCTYKWGTGACAGDSGGPLVNVDRNRLLGVVSFGFIYCGGYTGYPDGFTRVSNFTRWINERLTM